jgi:transposase
MQNKEQMQANRNKAYDLRLKGMSYRAIGMQLGVSHVTAQKWIKDYLAEETLPLVEEIRKQEVDRLLRYLDRLDERIDDGDDKAISLAIKISERLCKMLGADMPTQVEVSKTETTQVDLALQDLINRQKAQNALRLQEAASLRERTTDSASDESVLDDGESSIEAIVIRD